LSVTGQGLHGVIHIVPDLLVPSDFVLLNNAEKVLLSLNATRFVSLLRSANLSSTYAGDTKGKSYTILAPTDDVMDAAGPDWGVPLPRASKMAGTRAYEPDSALAALLRYHVIPGRLAPSEINDGMLLDTELKLESLSKRRQKLQANVSKRFIGNDGEVERGVIRFGGVAVEGTPGESSLYLD
jgi:uncharacterized surface protein with fasciclin (FAS1) repeats